MERCEIELRLLRDGIIRWGVGREIDRDGDRLGVIERDDIGARFVRDEDRIEDLERLGLELRTLREGIDRCGVGRETDLDGDRLGVDFGADRLAWLRLLLRELRRDDPASAARVRSRTAVTTAARIANFGQEVFFTRYILDLLSPAVFSGSPDLPALPPGYNTLREIVESMTAIVHLRQFYRHKANYARSLRLSTGIAAQPAAQHF